MTILELSNHSSHSRHSSECLAEILRSNNFLGRRSKRYTRPSTVSMVVLIPTSLESTREFPLRILHNGRIQSEIVRLCWSENHHSLEDGAIIDILNRNPCTTSPEIIFQILHGEGVEVVARNRKTSLKLSFHIRSQSRRRVFHSSSSRDRKRLLVSPLLSLFNDLCIHLIWRALQRIGDAHYTSHLPSSTYR